MAAKGYDDSPPRNGMIFFYSVLTVVFLFGAQQLLSSYFSKMMNNEYTEKVYTRGLDKAVAAKASDKETLEKSGIEAAMRLYAQRGRSASTVIQNESGAGKPGITGWSQLKREVPAASVPAAAVPVPSAAPTNAPPQGLPAGSGGQLAPRNSGSSSPQMNGASTTPSANRGVSPAPTPVTPGSR
jgi:hypothetical protein